MYLENIDLNVWIRPWFTLTNVSVTAVRKLSAIEVTRNVINVIACY